MHRASPAAPAPTRVSAPRVSDQVAEVETPSSGQVVLRMWPARSDLLMVGFWALLATTLGRGLAPALPGTTGGIGELILGVEQLAAFSSQFLVVMGSATCVRLLLSTLECRSQLFRPVAIVVCAAALPVIISASSRHLAPAWLISLVGLSTALGFAAVLPALRVLHSRAAGLVLFGVTCGSLVSAVGRIIALYASHHAQAPLFGLARAVATGGLLLDAATVALVAFWLARRFRFAVLLVAVLAGVGALFAWAGIQGEEAEGWRLVAGRALSALTAHPDPFIGSGVRYFVEVFAILLGAVTLWFRWPSGVGATLAFGLLTRVSGDVPLCSLMLMLAALSAVRASLEPIRPSETLPEPSGRRASLEVVPATR